GGGGGQPVHVFSQVAPGTGRARHDRLSAQLALRADLAGHGGYLLGEAGQGAGHLVDDVGERRDLALGLEHQLLVQIAMGDRGDDSGYATHLIGQVAGHQVNVVGQVFPGAAHALHLGLPAELALGAHLARHPGDLGGEGVELVDHGVDRVLQLQDLAVDVDRDLVGEVAPGDGGGHVGDVAHLGGQVLSHVVDVVFEVLPDAGHAHDLGLAAELAFSADL